MLRLDYDDGFVAYLNGAEVARRGFDSNATVNFDTVAHVNGQMLGEEIDLSSFTNLLVAGDNVLAIELHNSSLQDTSMILVPELLANFQRGPFVQDASATSITIAWKTPAPADTKVEYGKNSIAENLAFAPTPVVAHAVRLTN